MTTEWYDRGVWSGLEATEKVNLCRERISMPIITPPKIVQDATEGFLAPLFKNNPQRPAL